ncbi:MAG: hypothetical protein ACOYYS_20425 [Chloroflexota bacterium]
MKASRFILCIIVLLAASLSCRQATPTPESQSAANTPTQLPASGQATPTAADAPAPEQPAIDFIRSISKLDSYHLSFEITFRGSHAGQPLETRQQYTKEFIAEPLRTFTQIEASNGSAQPEALIFGTAGPASYFQAAADQPCSIRWDEQAATGVTHLDPLELLPAILPGGQVAGSETVNGISATRYTINQANLGGMTPEDATASGEYWLAEEGDWLVKLTLTVKGGPAYFGAMLEGEQVYIFEIAEANQLTDVTLPGNCQPLLTDVPILEDATILMRQPHSIAYTSNVAIEQAITFYEERMAASGWQSTAISGPEGGTATLFYERPDPFAHVIIDIQTGSNGLEVFVSVPAALATAQDGVQAPGDSSAGTDSADIPTRIANALGLVLGENDRPSVFASYHAEVALDIPGDGLKHYSADVQGKNIHLIFAEGGEFQEVYTIDEQEYIVEASGVREGLGLVGLTWVMWPLDVIYPYSIASAGPTFIGEEALDGRIAEVYALDSANVDPATLQALQSFSPVTIQQAKGTIWIDKETGGLLRLVLDYGVEGQGSGHIEITFSQIGAVSVQRP